MALFISPTFSLPFQTAQLLRVLLLFSAVWKAFTVGDGLKKDLREERYNDTEGKGWVHADVAWASLLASIGGTYWENGSGVCFAPQLFLIFAYAKEEPRYYRPTRFHGLMLPPTPPPRVAATLPLLISAYLLRSVIDLYLAFKANETTPDHLGLSELAFFVIHIALLAICLICTICARFRVGIWRLRSRRRRHNGVEDDSTLEYLLDPDERVEGYEDFDDVIREGLDFDIYGTVESLPAYTASNGNHPKVGPDGTLLQQPVVRQDPDEVSEEMDPERASVALMISEALNTNSIEPDSELQLVSSFGSSRRSLSVSAPVPTVVHPLSVPRESLEAMDIRASLPDDSEVELVPSEGVEEKGGDPLTSMP
ncbi:hypothetical protein HDU97_005025 [Phlyctochytrium planicorne]|nr:hypothetical protein HDU97_005025 [Phlyctochytrium planicorne]